MLPSIPSEASYASWLANCLQDYFESIGFSFYHEIQSQRREVDYPFDIYANVEKGNKVKRFGLQVKRPYVSKKGIYWKLEASQHSKMKNFFWIWYSFPVFLTRIYYKVALYHTLFKKANFPFVTILHRHQIGAYVRFGYFSHCIEKCTIGQKLDKDNDWIRSEILFKDELFKNQVHVYIDQTERKAQLFSNIISEIPE